MATTGVDAPGRAQIGAGTLRTDRWWIQPAVTFLALTAFVVYSAWRVFSGQYYVAEPYVSLYYSPCLVTTCDPGAVPGRSDLLVGAVAGAAHRVDPADVPLQLLLLPQGLLPVVLDVAARVRRRRAPRQVHR